MVKNQCPTDKLIILDLDETLIFSSKTTLDRPADFSVGKLHTYIRPYAMDLIRFCFNHFNHVAVWTSATRSYADKVCQAVFQQHYTNLTFIWSRERCIRYFNTELFEEEWIKDLNKVKRLGYPLENIIMIDNSPQKLRRHYGNLVTVKDYEGIADDELQQLIEYLPMLVKEPNIRSVEKRNWRRLIKDAT